MVILFSFIEGLSSANACEKTYINIVLVVFSNLHNRTDSAFSSIFSAARFKLASQLKDLVHIIGFMQKTIYSTMSIVTNEFSQPACHRRILYKRFRVLVKLSAVL